MNWDLHISYDGKPYSLKADVEYESAQIMRIRVTGKHSSMLLETNFPLVQLAKGKAIRWKIREGGFISTGAKEARLLTDIMERLEYYLKGKDSQISGREYMKNKKSW